MSASRPEGPGSNSQWNLLTACYWASGGSVHRRLRARRILVWVPDMSGAGLRTPRRP